MNLKPYPYSDEPPTGPSDIDGHSCRFPSPDHVHKVSLSLLFQVWRQLSGSTESPASFWNLLSTQPKWPCPLQHGYRAACPGYHFAFPLRVFASCSFMCLCLNPKENLGSLGAHNPLYLSRYSLPFICSCFTLMCPWELTSNMHCTSDW